ncbi:MAG: cytochrome c oxidase subunit II [Alphaproteobacteria bacterium]|nr:cytochrome c oxidase subunit II [Alphaproteobacteria bacterium]
MFRRMNGIGSGLAAAATLWATSALALPQKWGVTFQPPASEVMTRIEDFHRLLLYIIVAICIFVLVLLLIVIFRFNQRANPVPSKTHHNTLLEVMWTLIPVIILVVIAIPSFRLLYFEATIPKPDVTIKAIGKQWSWTYEYPGANFQFDSFPLKDADAAKAGEPRMLGVDNVVVVPVNKVVEVETTGADVIHSWSLPQMGVKMDAIPGRINHTWFKATQLGTFYGQCSELCGANHDFMPIEVKVVSDAEYAQWLATAKKKFASLDDGATRLAAK